MRPLTKSDRLIVTAKEAGYIATADGSIFNPDGVKLTGGVSRSGHINFIPNVVPRKDRSSVLAHRFIAYFFFGDDLFNHEVVRHLNDVPHDNRLENLALGSIKQNRADIPKAKLSEAAKKHAHLLVARSRKLSDEAVAAMRTLRKDTNLSYQKIASQFGISAMTAHRAINGQSWSNV